MRKLGDWYWVINTDLSDKPICAEWVSDEEDPDGFFAGYGEGFLEEQCEWIGERIPFPEQATNKRLTTSANRVYEKLLGGQEPLGEELSVSLKKRLWDLYEVLDEDNSNG